MDLGIKDVSELLQVSEETIKRWIEEGKIPAYRLNHQYRFSRIEVEDWMLHSKTEDVVEEEKRSGQQQYNLYRAIHKGVVLSALEGETKEEVIRGAMQKVAPLFGLDAEMISDLLLDRERLMPTALGHGLAVPHARDFLLQEIDRIAVVFPRQSIEYGALDGQPVHTLFFLFSSDDKRHLHLLAKIAHLGSNEEARALLATQPSKEELLDFIRSWEPIPKMLQKSFSV